MGVGWSVGDRRPYQVTGPRDSPPPRQRLPGKWHGVASGRTSRPKSRAGPGRGEFPGKGEDDPFQGLNQELIPGIFGVDELLGILGQGFQGQGDADLGQVRGEEGLGPGLAGLDQQLGRAGVKLTQKLAALTTRQDQGRVLATAARLAPYMARSVWLEKSRGCSWTVCRTAWSTTFKSCSSLLSGGPRRRVACSEIVASETRRTS